MALTPPTIFKKATRAIGQVDDVVVDVARSAYSTVSSLAGGATNIAGDLAGYARDALSAGANIDRALTQGIIQGASDPRGRIVAPAWDTAMSGLAYLDKPKDIPLDFGAGAFYDAIGVEGARSRYSDITFRDVGNTLARPVEGVPIVGGGGAELVRATVDPLLWAGIPLRGVSLAANLLGRGTLSPGRYIAANLAGAGASSAAADLGAPAPVSLAAGLVVGAKVGTPPKPTPRDILRTTTRGQEWDVVRETMAGYAGIQPSLMPWQDMDDITDPAVRRLIGLDVGESVIDSLNELRLDEPFTLVTDVGEVTVVRQRIGFRVEMPDGSTETVKSVNDAAAHLEALGVDIHSSPRPTMVESEMRTTERMTGDFDEDAFRNRLERAKPGEWFEDDSVSFRVNEDGTVDELFDLIGDTNHYRSIDAAVEARRQAELRARGWSTVEDNVRVKYGHYAEMDNAQLELEHQRAARAVYEAQNVVDAFARGERIPEPSGATSMRTSLFQRVNNLAVGDTLELQGGMKVHRVGSSEYDITGSAGYKRPSIDGTYKNPAQVAEAIVPEGFGSVAQAENATQVLLDKLTEESTIYDLLVDRGLRPPRVAGTQSAMQQVLNNLRNSGDLLNALALGIRTKRPMPVYHGTKREYEGLPRGDAPKRYEGYSVKGAVYATTDPRAANIFTEDWDRPGGLGAPRVYPMVIKAGTNVFDPSVETLPESVRNLPARVPVDNYEQLLSELGYDPARLFRPATYQEAVEDVVQRLAKTRERMLEDWGDTEPFLESVLDEFARPNNPYGVNRDKLVAALRDEGYQAIKTGNEVIILDESVILSRFDPEAIESVSPQAEQYRRLWEETREDLVIFRSLEGRSLHLRSATGRQLDSFITTLDGLVSRYAPDYQKGVGEVREHLAKRRWLDAEHGVKFLLTTVGEQLTAADKALEALNMSLGGYYAGVPLPKSVAQTLGIVPRDPHGIARGGRISPLPDWNEVRAEIKTGNPWSRALLGKLGINKMPNPDNPVAIIVATAQRLAERAEYLTGLALRGGLEPVSTRSVKVKGVKTPFSRSVLQLDADNMMTVSTKANPHVKGRVPWNEVAEHPQDFNLSPDQVRYFRRYREIVDETWEWLASMGLAPSKRDMLPGRYYIPRQHRSVRSLDLEKPANAWRQRIYETAIDAYANGLDPADPDTTLYLHVRAAYQHVINHMVEEAMAPFAVKPSRLIPLEIHERARDAAIARRDAGRALRRAQAALHTAQVRYHALKRPVDERYRALEAAVEQAKDAYKDATIHWHEARSTRRRAIEEARHLTHAKDWEFGGTTGQDISIELWQQKFFYRKEYADALREGMKNITETPEGAFGALYAVSALRRMLQTGLDLALPFTHGLPLLGTDPVAFARATLKHYQAVYDPTIVAKDIEENLHIYQWMARHGLMPTFSETYALQERGMMNMEWVEARGRKATEFREALRLGNIDGRGIRRFFNQVIKQTYGRTGATVELGLLLYRRALVEAMLPHWSKSEAELVDFIKAATGATSTRSLGISAGRRILESFIFISPRLLRSNLNLVAMLRHGPRDPRARAAARSLALSLAAYSGIFYGLGKLAGMDDEQLERSLNPLNGKEYLSIKIGDQWYGIGGGIRAIVQMLGGFYLAAAPEFHLDVPVVGDIGAGTEKPVEDLWALDHKNPLVNFVLTRTGPGVDTIEALTEMLTGGRIDAVPFDNIDNPAALLWYLSRESLPFSLAGQFEPQEWLRDPWEGVTASFLGLRTSPATPSERYREYLNGTVIPLLQQRGVIGRDVTDIDALGPGETDEARRIMASDPRGEAMLEAWRNYRRDLGSVFQETDDRRVAIDAKYRVGFDALYQELLTGTRDPREILNNLNDLRKQRSGELIALYERPEYVEATKNLGGNTLRNLNNEWFQIIKDVVGNKQYATDADWQEIERRQAAFLNTLPMGLRERFERDLSLQRNVVEAHPIIKLKREVDTMSEAYYKLPTQDMKDAYLKRNPDVNIARWLLYGGKLYSVEAVDTALAKSYTKGEVGATLAKANRDIFFANLARPINDAPEFWHRSKAAITWYFDEVVPANRSQRVLKGRPDLNAALFFWGYDVNIHTKAAAQYVNQFMMENTEWGRTGEWERFGPAILWWHNLSRRELFGDPKKNIVGAIYRRPDAEAAYAYFRQVMFGVPPVLYSEQARQWYAQFSGKSAEGVPVRSA